MVALQPDCKPVTLVKNELPEISRSAIWANTNSPVILLKIDSTTEDFTVILKRLLTLKRSICSGVGFQYSCEWSGILNRSNCS